MSKPLNHYIPRDTEGNVVLCYDDGGRTIAVLFDPNGGHHPCFDVTDERYDSAPRFWAGGMCGPSAENLADRIHENWFAPSFDDEKGYHPFLERC